MNPTITQEKQMIERANPNPPKTLKEFKQLSDRELLERQTLYLFKIENSNERIKLNLQFWFYFTIVCSVIGALAFLNS
jgi:hypothetical protein